MSAGSSSLRFAPSGGECLSLEVPPSLRRWAPAAVELTEERSRRVPAIDPKGVHLVSGRRYHLRLRAWPADHAGQVQDITTDGGDCLTPVTSPAWATLKGGGRECLII